MQSDRFSESTSYATRSQICATDTTKATFHQHQVSAGCSAPFSVIGLTWEAPASVPVRPKAGEECNTAQIPTFHSITLDTKTSATISGRYNPTRNYIQSQTNHWEFCRIHCMSKRLVLFDLRVLREVRPRRSHSLLLRFRPSSSRICSVLRTLLGTFNSVCWHSVE
jgi:hypothetical protein